MICNRYARLRLGIKRVALYFGLFLVFVVVLRYLYTSLKYLTSERCPWVDLSTYKAQSLVKQSRKWAIIALVKPDAASAIDQRNKAIINKLGPYAKHHNVDIIFFSELPFHNSFRQSMKSEFSMFTSVHFVNTSSNGFEPPSPQRFGYKYMCKFFSYDIYSYLSKYDYYLRLDGDSYIRDLDYDIFQYTHDNRIEYGYAMRKLEPHGPTKDTLPNFVNKYIEKCNIKPTATMDRPLDVLFNFYNNFHIGSVKFFTRPDVYRFLEEVRDSGFILSHRWGDSTIQAYAVRLFADPKRLVQLPNFTYIHGSHGNRVITTFNDGNETDVPQRLTNWKFNGR